MFWHKIRKRALATNRTQRPDYDKKSTSCLIIEPRVISLLVEFWRCQILSEHIMMHLHCTIAQIPCGLDSTHIPSAIKCVCKIKQEPSFFTTWNFRSVILNGDPTNKNPRESYKLSRIINILMSRSHFNSKVLFQFNKIYILCYFACCSCRASIVNLNLELK